MTQVKNDSTVKVHYTGKFEDGEIFDSSIETGREPLEAKLGQGQLIRGFEDGLIGMEVGDTKRIEIEPIDAYGDINEMFITEVPLNMVPSNVEVGVTLQASGPNGNFNVIVKEIKESTVVLDANHPLAGKKLIFDLELVDIQ
jgi:FKBP-type peptidyl-prolyl cis-trans isomerase SlpA